VRAPSAAGFPETAENDIQDLHRRHGAAAAGTVLKYYTPGRGYYPPAEAGPEQDRFGVCVMSVDGAVLSAGDWETPFALQSISKVFGYGLALAEHGPEHVLQRVGVEPSGDAFNSIVFDEYNGRPFNPMVNAGALATTALVGSRGAAEGLGRALALLRRCSGNEALQVDEPVFEAEMRGADRNRATAPDAVGRDAHGRRRGHPRALPSAVFRARHL
jgi:glutaminase